MLEKVVSPALPQNVGSPGVKLYLNYLIDGCLVDVLYGAGCKIMPSPIPLSKGGKKSGSASSPVNTTVAWT
jgi:hypothetical protein